jgi:tRNA pseudouridine55 synthase
MTGERSGLLLLNKAPGLTSFDALYPVKKALSTKKVGHTGTLDKFASGLLVVLAGRALKLAPWFSYCDKEYEAVVFFGEETDTLDPEGEVIARGPVPSREAVEEAIPRFTGEILQAPPVYSAIHINGSRASELARSGTIPEMKKRNVSIHSFELAFWEPPFAGIRLRCSSGTYVRSLARDLALAAASRGRLEALKRSRVAGFDLASAVETNSEIAGNGELIARALRPIDRSVFEALGLPWYEINSQDVQNIIHGRPLEPVLRGGVLKTPVGFQRDVDTAGIFSGTSFIAMIEKKNGVWKYGYVYELSPHGESEAAGAYR